MCLRYLNCQKFKLTWCQIRYYHEVKQYLNSLPKTHLPVNTERFWHKFWTENDLFKIKNDGKKPFVMLFPPPNVTGSLHLGHALTVSIEDAIIRHEKMLGKNVLWIPGFDHAGIATQMMIEKQIWANERKTRFDIGKTEFLIRAQEWARLRTEEIKFQLDKLGCSFNYDLEYFTLSETMSKAVTEAFIRLFNANMIYRDKRMVNWSFNLQSTLSDIEVKHLQIDGRTDLSIPGFDEKVTFGLMHKVKYPIEDSNQAIQVATTRLETMFGDVAIAVHPNDSRYLNLIGKRVINPLTDELIPVIANKLVDPTKGTGALKVTPAHDPIDYQIGLEHGLPLIDIFDSQGNLKCKQKQFNGLNRFTAKTVVQEYLQQKGFYCGYENHKQFIPVCSRSGDVIEMKMAPQWFMKCDQLYKKAMHLIDDKKLELIIPSFRNVWFDWVRHQKDWCISRQIWWGHRIPAWKLIVNGNETDDWVAAKCNEEALQLAKKKHQDRDVEVEQDNDVLDTWFSSGLLPLAVFGWPEQTHNFKNYFPLSFMETGHDIIFFWVVRMVILSIAFEDRLPFSKVLFHGMICDANGKKMSKSKGNVVDPLHVINGVSLEHLLEETKKYYKNGVLNEEEFKTASQSIKKLFPKGIPECGADALRLALLEKDFRGHQVNFDVTQVVANKKFCNKMFQTFKFFLGIIEKDNFQLKDIKSLTPQMIPIDRWILSCLANLVKTCEQSFHTYEFYQATRLIQTFWVNNLCDVYLECIKPLAYQGTENEKIVVKSILYKIFEVTLRCSHPFIPFVTEELFQRLKITQKDYEVKSICLESYPTLETESLQEFDDHLVNEEMDLLMEIITKIRMFKSEFLKPKEECQIIIASNSSLEKYKSVVQRLTFGNQVNFIEPNEISKYEDYYYVHEFQNENHLLITAQRDKFKTDNFNLKTVGSMKLLKFVT